MGQLGDGTTTDRLTPVDVVGLTSGVKDISVGYTFTCAVTTAGGAKCWGGNTYATLGDGTTTQRLTPVNVSGLTSGVAKISAGSSSACALTTSGGVKCWGANLYGALGDGTVSQRTTPVNVIGMTTGVASISASSNGGCGVTTGGALKCWGSYANGDFTGPGFSPIPLTTIIPSGVASVSTGFSGACAVLTSGGLKCFAGDLQPFSFGAFPPYDIPGLETGVAEVSVGDPSTACVRTTSNIAKCWGANHGCAGNCPQLGNIDVGQWPTGVVDVKLCQ